MRKFDSYIFMGNGDFSKRDCQQLHRRLDEGLALLSGLQQPGHQEIPDDENLDIQREICQVVKDLATALGFNVDIASSPYDKVSHPYNGGPLPADWDENEPKEPEMLELYRENKRLRACLHAMGVPDGGEALYELLKAKEPK